MSLFRDPSTPCHSANYAKRIHPLVSIHVTTLSKHPNVVLLGITVPHTLVDATGMGLIAKALDAELGGWAWTVPPLPLPDAPNPYSEATAKVLEEIKDEPPKETSLALRRDYVDATVWTRAVFIANVVWEYTWHRSELRVITLGADVVRKIVEPAKQEVKAMTDGREYVSTGDILVAWLLKVRLDYLKILRAPRLTRDSPKSVYGASSSKNLVSSCTVLSTRPLLPSLGVYPHNALVLSALPSVSIPALPTTPISALALLHRRQLIADRVPSILGEVHKYGDVVPRRDRGTDYWFHSNQIVAEITSFCSLGPLLGYWPYTMPGTLDHSTTFNELGDGYTILISMRRSRWKTMKKVLRKLEAEVQLEVDEGFFEKGQLSPSRGNYV